MKTYLFLCMMAATMMAQTPATQKGVIMTRDGTFRENKLHATPTFTHVPPCTQTASPPCVLMSWSDFAKLKKLEKKAK